MTNNPERSKNSNDVIRDKKDKGSNKIRRIRIPSSGAMMILDPISRVKYQASYSCPKLVFKRVVKTKGLFLSLSLFLNRDGTVSRLVSRLRPTASSVKAIINNRSLVPILFLARTHLRIE